jgi:hypothetical protein
MDEAQVKSATLSRIRQAAGRSRKPIVTAEFSLGDSGIRADLAVFAGELIGLEIKTEKDTLRRLSSQMKAYCRYFHHAVAIVAPSHLRNLTEEHIQGASLWTYDSRGLLTELHRGRANHVDPAVLETVLTQAERRKLDFYAAMEARYGGTSKIFWRSVARRPIKAEDLKLLSRFADSRAQAERFAAEREAQWSHWLAAQGC